MDQVAKTIDGIVVDVGANICTIGLPLAAAGVQVIGFEAMDTNVAIRPLDLPGTSRELGTFPVRFSQPGTCSRRESA